MGVLMLLMTIGGLLAAAVLFAYAVWTKKNWLKSFVLGGVVIWLSGYAILLFVGSFFSEEKMLTLNEPKQFCGFYLDCHLHTQVTSVRTAKTIGNKNANGTFLIASVKVFSDAKNPIIPFHLIEPKAEIYDANGQVYARVPEAEAELPSAQVQLNQDIKGSEVIEKELVYDVAEPAGKFKLLVTEGYGIDKALEAILIGDEDSIGHKRNYFQIEPETQTASR